MKAEDLITLAAAHGVDLKRIAGASTPARGPSVRRRRRSQDEIKTAQGQPLTDSATGSDTMVRRFPSWSLAELGQAAKGVPPIPWMAACFSFAGDRSVYWRLHDALTFEAYRMKRRYDWSPQITGIGGAPRFYLLELAQLVLDEDQHAHLFRAEPKLYAWYLHIDEPLWRHRVFERFDLLKVRYLGWLETARWMIQERLANEEQSTGIYSDATT